jgi:hypothetical protein
LRSLEARGLLGERRDASAWSLCFRAASSTCCGRSCGRLSAGAVDALCCAAAIGVELGAACSRCVPDESQLAAQLRELEAAGLLSSDSSFALRAASGTT